MPWLSVVLARKAGAVGDGIEIRGWVRTRRDSKGGFSFLEVNDGSCLANLQVVVGAGKDCLSPLTHSSIIVRKSIHRCGVIALQGRFRLSARTTVYGFKLADCSPRFNLE